MTDNDFPGWLEKGLGRAILFLKENDDAPYREQVVYACTHNMAFDRQTEGRSPAYYFDLINATKDPAYYRDRLLASMMAPLDGEYSYQMFAIAGLLAASGDESARAAMYEEFARTEKDDFGRADLLVQLDGYAGLQFVAEQRPILNAEEDGYELVLCVEILEERYGKEEAWNELERMAAENPVIAAWLAIARQTRRKWGGSQEDKKPLPALLYSEVKRRIEANGRKYAPSIGLWLRKASEEDKARMARDFLAETDPERIAGYLRLFRNNGFPLDPTRIIELLDYPDAEIAHWAGRTLGKTTHPKARAFALDCIAASRHTIYVVAMLAANYEPGDGAIVANLTELLLGANDYHHLQMDARNFVKAHWDEFSLPILFNLYEKGPCSLCRNACVEMLVEHNALPDWMRDEARFDADEETRRLFQSQEESASFVHDGGSGF